MILNKLKQVWKAQDLRNNILFVFSMLIIFRIVAHIPLPGVDRTAIGNLFNDNQVLGMINLFSGGGIKNFSIMALGIAPYITASIIMQLLTMVVPKLEEISKDGESGHHKINQYTRWLAVPLAILQSIALITLLKNSASDLMTEMSLLDHATAVIVMTAGTLFLMWLGEIITERKVGNGISLIIFAGILAGLPGTLKNTIAVFDTQQVFNLIFFALIAIITIVAVIYITGGQRNLPISYARVLRGKRMSGGIDTHLPLKVNQAGVIPIIFAISLVLFPTIIAQFFLKARSEFLVKIAEFVIVLFRNQLFYAVFYFLLVVAFTYFYTAIVFQPDKVAENLQKQGGFIPGIRPGKTTSDYISYVSSRIMLAGALFLGSIAILPLIVQQITGLTTLVIGGTSLLIIVSVILETVRQIDSQLTMRDYEEL